MSELSQAIDEMRNMRESYNELATAASAYNTGKAELATNITNKGVPAAASETLPELAEKVSAIAQESYTIDGGEMYAKQLYGSLTTPNYWNLYEVLMQLLSDGRLVNYGGILLAEYYKGYDSLALAGAGAGGAYVVSDKDAQGNFIMYTNDTTHTWDTAWDGKGNRWVAYCFADEWHDFQITDTNTSPRSIFIGRKVGTITSLVNGRISEIVVPDGNELRDFVTGAYSQQFNKKIILKIKNHDISKGLLLPSDADYDAIYLRIGTVSGSSNDRACIIATAAQNKTGTVIVEFTEDNASSGNSIIGAISSGASNPACMVIKAKNFQGGFVRNYTNNYMPPNNTLISDIESISTSGGIALLEAARFYRAYFYNLEELSGAFITSGAGAFVKYLYIGYKTNDKTRNVNFITSGTMVNPIEDIELQDGYCKPLNISLAKSLSKENVQAHIFDRLGVNDLSTGTVTITLATAVLNLFTQEEIDAVVARTNITIVGA